MEKFENQVQSYFFLTCLNKIYIFLGGIGMWADGIGAAKDATTIGSCIAQTAKKIFSYCCICKKKKIDLTQSTAIIRSLDDLLKEFNDPGYVMKEAKKLAESSLKKAG